MSTAVAKEAFPGGRTAQEMNALLSDSLKDEYAGGWCFITNWTDEWVAARIYGDGEMSTYQISYTMTDEGVVTWGDRTEVEERTIYTPVPTGGSESVEESVSIPGRVVEALGMDDSGGRVFRVRLIRYGESRNARDYPESVLRTAARLYEGAKAYDHHRTLEELQTSTVQGLVGTYLNVAAEADGLYGDLHLLPSATHIAEAFDQSLANQADELQPLVGISHDVQARFRSVERDGRRLQECTAIVAVQSADVVADPAAGGQATRTLAGGPAVEPKQTKEGTVPEPEEVRTSEAVPPKFTRSSLQGRSLVRMAVAEGLVEGFSDAQRTSITEAVLTRLPEDGFTESEILAAVEGFKMASDTLGLANLKPTVEHVVVTQEEIDKKRDRLFESLSATSSGGYMSIRQAYADITGMRGIDMLSAELPQRILRESHYGPLLGEDPSRASEAITSGTWGYVLADALHRRMIQDYNRPTLQLWRQLVSNIVPRSDFRSNKITRMGGYGTLPVVIEGGTYQPLASPTDEQATYAVIKRGGVEELTMETIANDDMGAVQRIPRALARAAAIGLYRFVIDTLIQANPTIYDSVALFHASHNNTATGAALSQSTLSAARIAMRKQAAFGASLDVLGLTPKYLLVPPDLEEIAYQLCTSAVAIPSTPAGPTNTPNIHQGLTPLVMSHWTDVDDWILLADPADCPTIEVGFFNGQEEPELFVQDDPNQGARFSADKVLYKIRHIYNGAILDYRGFLRRQG